MKKSEAREKQNRLEKLAFQAFAWLMTHPRLYEMAGKIAASIAPPGENGWIRNVPPPLNAAPVRAWLSQRDLPAPVAQEGVEEEAEGIATHLERLLAAEREPV